GERAVDVAAEDGAAHDQVVAAPSVLAAAARARLERAAEVGEREGGHAGVDVEFARGVGEGQQRGRQLREQIALLVDLVAVRVEAAERAEEDLALQSERAA